MKLTIPTTILFILFSTALNADNSKPNIFIDCQMRCHMNYVREQITFVNYMQDRQVADIYILATDQRTGAGGKSVQLVFQGNNQFTGKLDTITYVTDPNATNAIERDQMITELKKGLLKYIVHTDMIDAIDFNIKVDETESTTDNIDDPWNYWVFNVGGNGWFSGEQSFKNMDVSGRINANRITDQNKFFFSSRYSYSENTFKLSDGEEVVSVFRSYNIYTEYVKSITDHWSVGGTARVGSSTFGNTDINSSIRAAIEYNVYPYSEAQTRRFSFFYSIGPEFYDYTDVTIYDKLTEWVGRHSVNMQFEQTQKWGEIEIRFGAQQYLHNLNLYNAYFNPEVEWQIFKGFSIDFGARFSFVNDRINISKEELSDEDILLQIRQLDTDFSYYSYFGINYRFGSQYNNFVNPRF
ncbi:MAG: hypothetical protein HKN09_13795 [Saprospiraceae bacterium]|nr:hypothetical protein [Saprospiraceae bacterium]